MNSSFLRGFCGFVTAVSFAMVTGIMADNHLARLEKERGKVMDKHKLDDKLKPTDFYSVSR